MAVDAISSFINTVPFFSKFKDVEKSKLINRSDCFSKYGEGDFVFNQGDSGDTLYLVLNGKIGLFRLGNLRTDDGRVSLKKEVEMHVTDLPTGAIFGEISMLTDCKRNTTARVVSNQAVVMKITKKLIDSLNHPTQIKFHQQLLLSLATHLDEMNARYIDLKYSYDESLGSKSTNV
jgi:CRP/FNR family transcriptional regulator, cyclic AMP receptor protein